MASRRVVKRTIQFNCLRVYRVDMEPKSLGTPSRARGVTMDAHQEIQVWSLEADSKMDDRLLQLASPDRAVGCGFTRPG